MENPIGNKIVNFFLEGLGFFSKFQDLFFYDVLSSDGVLWAMWPIHVLQAWNVLYGHGPLHNIEYKIV